MPSGKKTAIIVRHESRSKDLAASLKTLGYEVVFLPLIEIAPPSDDFFSLDSAIKQLGEYDWLIFTSANGVKYFFDRLKHLGISKANLSRLNTAVVGPMTAKALESNGCHVSMIPREHSANGLIDTFSDIDIEGSRMLFIQARDGRKELTEFLRARGAKVDITEAYQVLPSKENYQLPEDFDAIYFFSPSAVKEFINRFGCAPLLGKTIHPIGETTAGEIEKYIPHSA